MGVSTRSTWGIASQLGHLEVVQILLKNGAKVDSRRNTDGMSALFIASCKGHTEIVRALLLKNPSLGMQRCGSTPLHAAAYNGHRKVVELLLENNANPTLLDKNGDDCVQIAKLQGHDDLGK